MPERFARISHPQVEEKEGDSGGNILLVVAGGVGPDGQLKRTVEVIEFNLKHAGITKTCVQDFG